VNRPIVGIVPAAGQGCRLFPLRYPKELLPIVYSPSADGKAARPMLVIEHSLNAMRTAGVRKCLVIVTESKFEILRYLGDGASFGVHIAYCNQVNSVGLAEAVDAPFQWLEQEHVCLALPDTVFQPLNALRIVCDTLLERNADLVLGVFPSDQQAHLAPVHFGSDGRVLEVFEKPTACAIQNTWGVASWSPRFTRFLHCWLKDRPSSLSGRSLSDAFNDAIAEGLHVYAEMFPRGQYVDLGTAENLGSLVLPDPPVVRDVAKRESLPVTLVADSQKLGRETLRQASEIENQ
jgi:glucose-1-phosphate thymidylyltransferase